MRCFRCCSFFGPSRRLVRLVLGLEWYLITNRVLPPDPNQGIRMAHDPAKSYRWFFQGAVLRRVVVFLVLIFIGCDTSNGDGQSRRTWFAKANIEPAQFVRAIIEGDEAIIDKALEQGIDPNAKNRYGDTALIWAVYKDRSQLAKILLERGANPNIAGTYQKGPMHWAAEAGLVQQLNLLLKNGAKIDIYDDHFQTPLHFAVKKGRSSAVAFLVKKGADPDWVDEQGKSPLYLAVEGNFGGIVEILVLAGANPEKPASDGSTPLSLAIRKNRQRFFQSDALAKGGRDYGKKIEASLVTVETNTKARPRLDRLQMVRALHRLTNAARNANHLPALVLNENLSALAQAHSKDMVARGFFEHVNPGGENPLQRAQRMGFEPPPFEEGERVGFGIGENIYQSAVHGGIASETEAGTRFLTYQWLTQNDLAKQIVNGWMASDGHRQNILNPEFTHQGFGFEVQGDRIWVTQNFYFPMALNAVVDGRQVRPDYRPGRMATLIHDAVNRLRKENKRPSLAWDEALAEIAKAHGQDMVKRGFFEHVNPDGEDASARAQRSGFKIFSRNVRGGRKTGVGENLSMGKVHEGGATSTVGDTRFHDVHWLTEAALVAKAVEEWWHSPGHRANMLNRDYERSGVAVVFDGNDQVYVIHNFY